MTLAAQIQAPTVNCHHSTAMPLKIGLTMRVVTARRYAETRDALSQDWPKFMREVLPEAIWMPLPNLGKDIVEYAGNWKLNGFIVTGGNDLFEYPQRDQTEMALIEFALSHNLPIFGICRGFQIMAHYFGYAIKPCEGHAGTRHDVELHGDAYRVNSYHNRCGPLEVKQPLAAFARDRDGHIEGFKHQNKPLMAVLWHPEREIAPAVMDRRMIRECFGVTG